MYEDQKHLLHKTKQDNSSQSINNYYFIIANLQSRVFLVELRSDLDKGIEDKNKEVSTLQQSLVEARQQLQHFKEHEIERGRHLKNALETYMHSGFQ